MEIATVINVHNLPEMARDVIDSVRAWVTRKIVLVVDKAGWENYSNFTHPDTEVVCGVFHKANRSPYKNWIVGMSKVHEMWPDVDWYNYIEYDVLYLNSDFKKDLKNRKTQGYSMVGFNHEVKQNSDDHWLVKKILSRKDIDCHKILGAITFFSKRSFKKLNDDVNFFNEVLEETKDFEGAEFPDFKDYAVEEILFPSVASTVGRVGNLSPDNSNSRRYAVRFADQIRPDEINPETSILHPLKDEGSIIHSHYRKARKPFLKRR